MELRFSKARLNLGFSRLGTWVGRDISSKLILMGTKDILMLKVVKYRRKIIYNK